MKTEAKELIQEGLKLFSSYNRDTLKMFYRSAKENEADLSHLDKKYLIHVLRQKECFLTSHWDFLMLSQVQEAL